MPMVWHVVGRDRRVVGGPGGYVGLLVFPGARVLILIN